VTHVYHQFAIPAEKFVTHETFRSRQPARRALSLEFLAIVHAIRDSRIAAFANELVWGALATTNRSCGGTKSALRTPRRNLFEQRPQILKHGVFFVGARAIGEKELLA
jgi:hypothetical protein